MANELIINYPTGATLYALLFDGTGQVWNGSSFVVPASADWLNYDIAMSEVATATGIYRGTMPAAAAGVYGWTVRKQAGGTPAVADIAVGVGTIHWTGTVEDTVPALSNVTELDGSAEFVDNLVLALGSGGLVEKLNTTLELDGAVYRFTLNALEQAPDSGLTAGETGDAVLDEVVEGAYTMRQLLRIMLAALAGKSSGGGTSTITFRDVADSKNRISATVGGTGNRTAITLDGS